MDFQQVVGAIIGLITALGIGGLLARWYYSPKEKAEHANVTKSVEAEVEAKVSEAIYHLAHGTVEVATGLNKELEAQYKRMAEEVAQTRKEMQEQAAQIRREHAEEIMSEHDKVIALRKELDEMGLQMHNLRQSLTEALRETEACQRRVLELEGRLGG